MNAQAEPFFLSGPSGRLFALWHRPAQPLRRAVLHVPAFGEEMNKSRRMVALLAQHLRARDTGTLLLDLWGTGDSEGTLEQVDLQIWRENLKQGLRWLRDQGSSEIVLWGHRLGALLALDLLAQESDVQRALLWNPVTSGERFITQFLRLRTANSLMRGERESVKDLRAALERDAVLEVAGCLLPLGLVAPLEQLKMANIPVAASMTIGWFDAMPDAGTGLNAAAGKIIDQWRHAGVICDAGAVAGERFWSTQEISLAPQLLDASAAFIENTTADRRDAEPAQRGLDGH